MSEPKVLYLGGTPDNASMMVAAFLLHRAGGMVTIGVDEMEAFNKFMGTGLFTITAEHNQPTDLVVITLNVERSANEVVTTNASSPSNKGS